MSEKMDGVRAFWNGRKLISKQAKEFSCPAWFTDKFSSEHKLDGELWLGRGKIESLLTIINSTNPQLWNAVKYVIFDMPSSIGSYESRIESLTKLALPPHVAVIETQLCSGNEELIYHLHEIVAAGGEGLMLNKPNSLYVGERTSTLLKVKVFSPFSH
jgi:DNA ligase-1